MTGQIKNKPSGRQKISEITKEPTHKKSFLQRSVPLYMILLLSIIPVCSLGFYFLSQKGETYTGSTTTETRETNVKLVRNRDQNLIHPLLFVDIESENFLSALKSNIDIYLEQKKQEGSLLSASVYLKDLNTGYYFCNNRDTLYDPASLMKVPMMMVYLKQAETNPGLLKKTYRFIRDPKNKTTHLIKDKSLVEGNTYTVEQLLYYMIVYSDNESFWILSDNMDDNKVNELDTRLDIPANYDVIHYPAAEKHFIANVSAVAHYFNVLYNASYLNSAMSVYALDLLTKSTYAEGMVKQVENGVTIAHKFGERTLSYMQDNRLQQLYAEFHEFGIIYLQNRPYLLGVMTRGNRSEQLPGIVGHISKMVYDELKAH